MASLFNIGEEFTALYELADTVEYDNETGELIDNSEILKELFEELSNDKLDVKLENVMYIIKDLGVSEKALKEEAKRLTLKAKAFENRASKLKDMIKDVMDTLGQTKVKTDKFNFSVRTIDDYNYDEINLFGLDSEFIKIKEELDKTKIKSFAKAGGTIEGLRVTEKTSLTVR